LQSSLEIMSVVLPDITFAQYNTVYNALSFGIAGMGAASVFVYFQLPNVLKKYRTALIINALVTAIATYHYFRIFNSWDTAYQVGETLVNGTATYSVVKSGTSFNDAYRYVDWLLTVPLLLIELILVMGLSASRTRDLTWKLGVASAIMVAVGYPGESSADPKARWVCWALAMIPFLYVVYNLMVGLAKAAGEDEDEEDEDAEALVAGSAEAQLKDYVNSDENVQSLIAYARYLTAASWLTYPVIYLIKSFPQVDVSNAMVYEQTAYSLADVLAKAVFGILIWAIASAKSDLEENYGKRA